MYEFFETIIKGFVIFGIPALSGYGVKSLIPGEPFYENVVAIIVAIIAMLTGLSFSGGVHGNEK